LLFEAKSVVICPPGAQVGVADGVPVAVAVIVGVGVGVCVAVGVAVGVALGEAVAVGVGDPKTHAKGVGVAVGDGPGAPAKLNAPIRNRHPMELVVGTYSLTTQKVVSSSGSISIEV